MRSAVILLVSASMLLQVAFACTSMAVSPGATADGSSFVTYNADDWDHYGFAQFLPAAVHPNGTMRQVFDGDSRQYLGEIPEASQTFNVVHFANEFGVTIGESTFGGIDLLGTPYPGSVIDYVSLMLIGLQRSRTARELINTMGSLVMQFGYASTGESFSIADNNEAWIMEIIGRGTIEKGAVWVARRLPDGYVTAHANQARITTFPRNDPANCLFAPDVVDFARKAGLYPVDRPDTDFSFSDIFDPVTPTSARVCEARVWSLFQNITNGELDSFLDYARGWNLTNRMPLWVKPVQPLTLDHMFSLMKNNYDGTFFEASNSDVDDGAGHFYSSFRPRGLTWQYQGQNYVNERPVATQQTFANMVVQVRQNFPTPALGTVVWFGVDSAMHTCRIPLYTGIQAIPRGIAFGTADVTQFSFDSAFWVTNMVANIAYSNMQLINPVVQAAISDKLAEFKDGLAKTDALAIQQWAVGDTEGAINTATVFSTSTGDKFVSDWLLLWQKLFMKYFDYAVHTPVPGSWQPNIDTQPMAPATYRRIVQETGDKYLMPSSNEKKLSKRV